MSRSHSVRHPHSVEATNLRELRRPHARRATPPPALVRAWARATATAKEAWADARPGAEVPDDAHGCPRDIHWSRGAFGYFCVLCVRHWTHETARIES